METRKVGSLFCLDTPSGLLTLGPTLVNNAVTRSVNREVLPVHSKHSVKWLQQKHSNILLITFWHVMLGFAHCRVTSSLLRRPLYLHDLLIDQLIYSQWHLVLGGIFKINWIRKDNNGCGDMVLVLVCHWWPERLDCLAHMSLWQFECVQYTGGTQRHAVWHHFASCAGVGGAGFQQQIVAIRSLF